MTLLLGVLTKHCAVVATDGYSVRTFYDGKKVVEKTDLQKCFPLTRSSVLVHHGENVLSGKSIEQIIGEHSCSLSEVRSPLELGYQLFPTFDRLLLPLAAHLSRVGSGFGLWIVGYDRSPFLHELWWDSNLRFKRIIYPEGELVWAGNGMHFAEAIFRRDRIGEKCIRDFLVDQAQDCLRSIYRESLGLQGDAELFGGEYREITMTENGYAWTAGREEAKSQP